MSYIYTISLFFLASLSTWTLSAQTEYFCSTDKVLMKVYDEDDDAELNESLANKYRATVLKIDVTDKRVIKEVEILGAASWYEFETMKTILDLSRHKAKTVTINAKPSLSFGNSFHREYEHSWIPVKGASVDKTLGALVVDKNAKSFELTFLRTTKADSTIKIEQKMVCY